MAKQQTTFQQELKQVILKDDCITGLDCSNRWKLTTIFLFSVLSLLYGHVHAQCKTSNGFWSAILNIEQDNELSDEKKLKQALRLKAEYDDCKLPEDSVYARLLHRIAALQYTNNGNVGTSESVDLTLHAIRINTSGSPSACPAYAINNYFNLATFYRTLNLGNKALLYYDTVIALESKSIYAKGNVLNSRIYKADIFFKNGDYQKCIDECTARIPVAKEYKYLDEVMALFNRRAQSYIYLGLIDNAMADADSAEGYARRLSANFELASTLKIKAEIAINSKQYAEAISLFNKAIVIRLKANEIAIRLKTDEYDQVSDDYTDLGNFYLQKLMDYEKAGQCYTKTIEFAQKSRNAEFLCKGYINLAEVTTHIYTNKRYKEAQQYYLKALKVFGINDTSFLHNPELNELSAISNTDLLLTLLNNKTEMLLNLFKETGKPEYINACLKSAMVMDSAIVQARRQQAGEQSKLYWRNKTRPFFANVIQACYLANNMPMAFYFMEKSRAVLLNDKLNELNASIHLPQAEEDKEQRYLLRIIDEKKKLKNLLIHTPEYNEQQIKVLQASAEFEQYVKNLERTYPLYYQYKYADDIPSLPSLQLWLSKNDNAFIHYFAQDTVMYMLAVEAGSAKMLKVKGNDFDISHVNSFLKWCANKQQLNNNYTSFITLSHSLYKTFFEPLHISSKRVMLCQDNFLLPFEALCADKEGKKFLIYDYIFSYTYSASYLLKTTNNYPSAGNYIGFAPVSFQSYLSVPDLKNAAQSLKKSAASYNNPVLFENKEATKNNFLSHIANYNIVNVFSHALADTSNMEPLLYMQDSVINLSELQLLNKPATQLVMLSACQTNVGKTATGEGIYSLARGFASAGIPAVSATLWKADEETIYIISKKFNEFIALGMRKDEALQKAKLFCMQQGDKEKLLPYFWANMVLIGNGEPVHLLAQHSQSKWWLIIASIAMIVTCVFLYKKYVTK